MNEENVGVIYILTNPSFPQFVKIGYASDVEKRLKDLNRSECIPFAFRLYAYYKVNVRLSDVKLHELIDKINPTLRSIEYLGETKKARIREFYQMDAQDAYFILEAIATIHGLENNLVLCLPTEEEQNNEEKVKEFTKIQITQQFKNN